MGRLRAAEVNAQNSALELGGNSGKARLSSRCSCGVIDVHTHFVPAKFPSYAGRLKSVDWPSMTDAISCSKTIEFGGRPFRTLSPNSWDAETRIGEFEKMRVAHQVVSPMPELLGYWLDREDGLTLCQFVNDEAAALAAKDPTRFTAIGSVPLQDLKLAIRELDRLVNQLGLAGVEIGTNVNGMPIGDASLFPFFEAAEDLGAAVFVHALRPTGMDRLVGPPILEQALAFPTDVGLAAASMLTGGTLRRCPDLRIAFSHGGGSLALLLPRLQHVWQTVPALAASMEDSPKALAGRLMVDNLVYDNSTMRFILSTFGERNVMLGTDYPYPILEPDPVGRLVSTDDGSISVAGVSRENAIRWIDGVTKE